MSQPNASVNPPNSNPGNGNQAGWPSPAKPLKVAREYLEVVRPIIFRNGEWLAYENDHWQTVSVLDIRNSLYETLEDVQYWNPQRNELVDWNPNKNKIANVLDALPSIASPEHEVAEGGWFRQPEDDWLDQLDAEEWLDESDQFIPCRNGLLRLSDRKLFKHSRDHFNRYVLNCDYDRLAVSDDWEKQFIPTTFDNDIETYETAEEFGGYVISGDTTKHKLLDIYGPSRSGKGTYVQVVSSFLPESATVGLVVDQFLKDERFGLGNLVGRSLISISDQRERLNDKRITRLINNVVGCDPVMARSPFGGYFNGPLPGRLIISDNEMTVIPDDSGSIAARTICIRTPNSYVGAEDSKLRPRLCSPENLSGILNRFLDGLDRLNDRGDFRQPKSAERVAHEMRDQSSPVRQFLKAYCTFDANGRQRKIDVYNTYLRFCRSRNLAPLSEPRFAVALYSTTKDKVGQSRPRIKGERVQMYTGIRLVAGVSE